MKLDTIALIIVALFAGLYALAIFVGALVATPFGFGIPILILFFIAAYVLYRLIAERRANAEDDYYERNVDQ